MGSKFLRLLPWLGLVLVLVINLRLLFGVHELLDFGSFVASGRAAQAGQDPYAVYPLTARGEYQGIEYTFPNLNPPAWLPVFEGLARLDPFTAKTAWISLSFLLYCLGVFLLYRQQRPPPIWVLWAFSLAGLWNTLMLGQVYAVLFLLAVAGWVSLRREQEILAGVFIGIAAALKPNLLVWPVILLLVGRRKAALWAGITFIGLSLLPLLRYPPLVYAQWFEAARGTNWSSLPHYLSVFSVAARFGVPWLGWLLAPLLLVGVAWWAWKYHPPVLQASAVAIAAAILASPLATPRFTLLLVPAFFVFNSLRGLRLPAGLLAIPVAVVVWLGAFTAWSNLAAGLIYPIALFISLSVFLGPAAGKSLLVADDSADHLIDRPPVD